MHSRQLSWLVSCLFHFITLASVVAAPDFIDEQFELPPGFRIYRAATAELAGGSYALTFDGEGRLLVGDGNAVRRMIDLDGDGVFDSYEVIAEGLGWRGPQGLLVVEDNLFAVGGDGIQRFSGYRSGKPLVHAGRVGKKFNTGGDHDAHTLLRGHDGYLYFMAGNGSGIEGRKHITEASSPCLTEREASVFRISPNGKQWECVGSGGRNPPSLGMNYLGELFSFDSDMEWHVGLPWYRPVRLNHWLTGGDQGWHDMGALPSYYIDNLPPVLEVGRGSPTSGRFYEHVQFPETYRNSFIVCDYRWKRESDDQYATTGRLVAFFLKRDGARWTATMEPLARPRPGALDRAGRPINFALVDTEIAPDGSLFITDHNQGIWRLMYDPERRGPRPIQPKWTEVRVPKSDDEWRHRTDELISLPQPGAEWSRLREVELRRMANIQQSDLYVLALSSNLPIEQRLRALRLAASEFSGLPPDFATKLAADGSPEMRGQAAWLMGISQQASNGPLLHLLKDRDSFVRRRAAEALTRKELEDCEPLLTALGDADRMVAYAAMMALTHQSRPKWLFGLQPSQRMSVEAPARNAILLRGLVAAHVRGNRLGVGALIEAFDEQVKILLAQILSQPMRSRTMKLDVLRGLGLYRRLVLGDRGIEKLAFQHLLKSFPDADRDVRWEQVRLVGEFDVKEAFPELLLELEREKDEVTQFHLAQAISRLSGGWSAADGDRLVKWFLSKQSGWFTEFSGKGVEFPDSWLTVLDDFGARHRAALLREQSSVNLSGQLGKVVVRLLASEPKGDEAIIALYGKQTNVTVRLNIARVLKTQRTPLVHTFLRQEYPRTTDPALRALFLQGIVAHQPVASDLPMILEGLSHVDTEVVRSCMEANVARTRDETELVARALISRLADRRPLFRSAQKALVTISRANPPNADVIRSSDTHVTDAIRSEARQFWQRWFAEYFNKPFELNGPQGPEMKDEDLHKFLLADSFAGGDPGKGAKLYEALGCHQCHGGGVAPGREGRLFGPDLAGVLRRLNRAEVADAIVYPSKQVADRFKGYEVELKDGRTITGFITEQNDAAVTISDREQVQRLARSGIQSIKPQSVSLMPANQLNRLRVEELRDLMAFLAGVPASK